MTKNKHGFTLIELLIVIAIIGLIASAIIVSFSSARKKARDAKAKTDFEQMATAMELYFHRYEKYVSTGSNCSPSPIAITQAQSDAGIGDFLKPIPMGTGVEKYYWCNPEGITDLQSYCFIVKMEQPQGNNNYFYFSEDGSGYRQTMACP